MAKAKAWVMIPKLGKKKTECVIDMRPLVLCKHCKYRDPEDKKCDSGHDIRWNLPRPDDWFCADGEAKQE